MLAYHFLKLFCRKTGKRIEGFSDEALENMINYDWPGNVRQLKNEVERQVIMAENTTLEMPYLRDHLQKGQLEKDDPVPETLKELKTVKKNLMAKVIDPLEKIFLLKAVKNARGNITGPPKGWECKDPIFVFFFGSTTCHRITSRMD